MMRCAPSILPNARREPRNDWKPVNQHEAGKAQLAQLVLDRARASFFA